MRAISSRPSAQDTPKKKAKKTGVVKTLGLTLSGLTRI